MIPVLRSLLFVPGTRPERFDKALASQCDLVCIDLEDACLPAEKATARESALNYIAATPAPQAFALRINSPRTPYGIEDLAAIIARTDLPPFALMLPKVATATDLEIVDQALEQKNLSFIALIESCEGVSNAMSIASASDRLSALMFGGGDLSAELGTSLDWEPLLFARSQLALAAGSRQLALIDVPYLDVQNPDGLAEESLRVKGLGYTGKAAIHPSQVSTINRAFTPSEQQVKRARRIVDAYQQANGGAVLVDGRMIDLPLVVAAKRIVATAETLGK